MIGFVMLGSNDIRRARDFYDRLLSTIGAAALDWSTADRVWYASGAGAPMLVLTTPFDGAPATPGNGAMVALVVASQEMVARVHAEALDIGATDEGAPGFRSDAPGDLYRAYFRDPDGNKLMVFANPQG